MGVCCGLNLMNIRKSERGRLFFSSSVFCLLLAVPAGGHAVGFLAPDTAAAAAQWNILVARDGAATINATALFKALGASGGHLEHTVGLAIADEAAHALGRVLGADGTSAAMFPALGERNAETHTM